MKYNTGASVAHELRITTLPIMHDLVSLSAGLYAIYDSTLPTKSDAYYQFYWVNGIERRKLSKEAEERLVELTNTDAVRVVARELGSLESAAALGAILGMPDNCWVDAECDKGVRDG